MKYKTVLFDIDDTLIDFRKSQDISLKNCYEAFFSPHTDFAKFQQIYSHINHALWQKAEKGKISPSEIGKQRFKEIAQYFNTQDHTKIPHFYEQQLIQNATWIDGAISLLDHLIKRGIKIGFITNGFSHIQRSKYDNLNLRKYSDVLVISEEIGFSKPHPQIYLHALKLLDGEIENSLMVGDSLTSDGMGAKELGISFCWYNPNKNSSPPDWQPSYIITDLTELCLT